MKTNRYVIFGILILALTAFGFGCGGTASTPAAAPGSGGVVGGGGGGGAAPMPGSPASDLDGDGIPDAEDPDADGDGFLGNTDDCNDLDPSTFPGAQDRPDHPNYTDSNCDGIDGDIDFAFWVAPDGDDANPGTIDQPFLTIQKGIDEASAVPEDARDVYVVEGVYNGDAMLTEGVGLYGGYGSLDGENLRPRDIDANLTENNCLFASFFVAASSTEKESVIEGITFRGIPDNPTLYIVNASPEIRYNKIYGVDSAFGSAGVLIRAWGDNQESRPLFSDNIIESRDTVNPGSSSIGLLAVSSGLNSEVEPTLNGNNIKSGNAQYASIAVGTFSITGRASLTAFKNNIEGGTADNIVSAIMMGFNIFREEPTRFARGNIYQNRLFAGENADSGFSILMINGTSTSTLTNNFITGGKNSAGQSAGVYVHNSTTRITNNTINAGSAVANAINIVLASDASTRIENNIFFAEDARSLIGIMQTTADAKPRSLRNNLFDDVLNLKYFDDGDLIVDIADVNAIADIADIGDNIDGNAGLEDVENHNYHIGSDSDAIDNGLDIGETAELDFDDDSRPQFDAYDIGADEFVE